MFTSTFKSIPLLAIILAASVEAHSVAATIDSNTLLDASNPFLNETLTIVDGASPPTRLTVLDGARVTSDTLAIDAYGLSIIDMRGGSLNSEDFGLRLNDDSKFILSGGRINSINFSAEARDRSMIELRGGERLEGFKLLDSSYLHIISGDFDVLQVDGLGNSRTVMTGGRPSEVELYDDASFVLHNGILAEALITNGRSRALIKSGGIGSVVRANGESLLTVRGGLIPETVVVFDSATIHFYGTGLHFDEDDLNPQVKLIQGTLADGTNLDVRYQIHDQGEIILHEVPEPGSWALMAMGATGVYFARRWRERAA